MADGTVGVRQANSPDRLIDNEVLTVGAQTVYRQRVQDPETIALLEDIKAAVEGTIIASISGAIALDASTLAALETINAVVAGAVSISGDVELGAATLAALETVSLDTATLAALESVTATISGAVALDASTLAALESITATISGTVAVSNFPASQAVTGPLTDTELRASAPAVKDDYQTGECLADQTGVGGVLTFTFASDVHLVVVDANGTSTDIARADPFGGTPTATLGVVCRDEVPTYMPVTTDTVKVYAPTGMVVSVIGYRRS